MCIDGIHHHTSSDWRSQEEDPAGTHWYEGMVNVCREADVGWGRESVIVVYGLVNDDASECSPLGLRSGETSSCQSAKRCRR